MTLPIVLPFFRFSTTFDEEPKELMFLKLPLQRKKNKISNFLYIFTTFMFKTL